GYRQILSGLRESGIIPDRVVHLWGLTGAGEPAPVECQQRGFYSLLALAQAWSHEIPAETSEIAVVTDGVQRVSGRERLCPAKATVLGLCRAIPQEHPGLRCRSVDLDLETDAVAGDLAEHLLAELALPPAGGAVVAWRGGERWVQSYEPIRLAAPDGPAPVLRPGGVYLITGGLGGIALTMARSLARSVGARLVLTGRTGLPERESWDGWLAEHGPGDAASRRILAVRELERLGAEVLVLCADAAHPEQMREAVRLARERFGALHGVIHAAGVVSPQAFRPVAQAEPEDCEVHFRPKVYGLLALAEAVRGLDLDVRLLLSSISTVLGGHGLGAYAAANAFLDAFAESRAEERWLSVDWDAWLVSEQTSAVAAMAEVAMSQEEGADAFQRVLTSGRSGRLVHSTGDLETRIARWVRPAVPAEAVRTAQSAPAAGHARPVLQSAYAPARNELERRIAALWQRALGISQVGIHDNFFDLGGNSLIGVQLVADLRRELGVEISNVTLFEAPTVSALARLLSPPGEETAAPAAPAAEPRQVRPGHEIAVVGMAGRFPGAPSVEELWRNLRDGVETITFFSDEDLLEAGIDADRLASPAYVKARPILADIEGFDAHFFGFSPRDAAFMDPQHRLFLECAWQALENAGHDPRQDGRPVGVFAGCNLSTYLLYLQSDPEIASTLDPFQIAIGNDKDSMPTSVSYKLDLKGPSVAVQTHCSTSLVAVHLACQNLRAGECDLALAGGVSVRVPQKFGYRYQKGGQESPDGHCRSFDAAAAGTVFGDGVAAVVLKRLEDALADGDTIHAVI
ncbi:MAG TPA: SDR family oxidoreductase, partial [Thermoanaerobaculia bacterium]|nr:SDR family oxidoreductase [Thermoanaerobaculia bacterium]